MVVPGQPSQARPPAKDGKMRIVYWTLIQRAGGLVGYYADGEGKGNWRIQNFPQAPNSPIVLHDREAIKTWLQKARPEPKYRHVYLEPEEFQRRAALDSRTRSNEMGQKGIDHL